MSVERKSFRGFAASVLTAGVAIAALAATTATATRWPTGRFSESMPLGELLQILISERQVLALGALGGSGPAVDLESGESVVWHASQGRVGIVLTDRRLLAVTSTSSAWQEARRGRDERMPERAVLGDRIALAATGRRVLGFDGVTGNLLEARLGPRESVERIEAGANVGVALTSRRALAVSAYLGGLFEWPLGARERVEAVEVSDDLVSLTTSHHLLIFRASTGRWVERRVSIR